MKTKTGEQITWIKPIPSAEECPWCQKHHWWDTCPQALQRGGKRLGRVAGVERRVRADEIAPPGP